MKPQHQNTNSHADHTGAIAEALFIANLLFVGIAYLILWLLYLLKHRGASAVGKNHLRQTLIASTISTSIVVLLNVVILLTSGYSSATALILAELYLMLVVPAFLLVGILGFIKAVNNQNFKYPIIGKLLGIGS